MDLKKVVLVVVGIVVGILMVVYVVIPTVDIFLERPDVEGFTGLAAFARFLPLLAVLALVVGGLLVLFRHSNRDGETPDPPTAIRFHWRRR